MSDSSGLYHICGIPGDMTGKVQVFRNGVKVINTPAQNAAWSRRHPNSRIALRCLARAVD